SVKPFIATKCSRKQKANGELYSELKRESIIREAEESLRRLQVETIDLYQLHWPRPEEDIEEGWETVAQLIKQGKVRYGGVSNFNIDQMQKCQPIMPITSLQPPYNMLVRTIEDGILDYCDQHKIAIVSYSPLYKGLFSGRFSLARVKNLPESDHRRRDPHFIEPELSLNLKLVSELSQIAHGLGVTVAHLSLAWIFRHPQITSIIVGCRNPQQVEENVAIKDVNWGIQVIDEIENHLRERELAMQGMSKRE
ncbi:MAG: aldo/keto reductase, partial [Calditrichaeota bacterium]